MRPRIYLLLVLAAALAFPAVVQAEVVQRDVVVADTKVKGWESVPFTESGLFLHLYAAGKELSFDPNGCSFFYHGAGIAARVRQTNCNRSGPSRLKMRYVSFGHRRRLRIELSSTY